MSHAILAVLLAFMLAANAYFVTGWLVGAMASRRDGRPFGDFWSWTDLLLVHLLILVFGTLTAVDWVRDGIPPPSGGTGEVRRFLLFSLFAFKSGLRATRFTLLMRGDVAADGIGVARSPANP